MANDKTEGLLFLIKAKATREEGFRRLMKEYGEKLYWSIRRIVVGHEDAEDVMQDAIIKIYESIDSFRGDSSIGTWIYRIAINEALRFLQKKCSFLQSIDSLSPALSRQLTTDNDISEKEIEVAFQKALLTLPTQQRIAFNLRYYDEMPYEEIAKITGKKVNTLKTNYHFAAEKIKNYLKEQAL